MKIKNYVFIFIVAFVAALLAFVIGSRLVGNQSALGATGQNRYPNSGIAAKFLAALFSPATSTVPTDGSLTVDGPTNITDLVYGDLNGALPAVSVASAHNTSGTLTAAQVCDNSVLDITFASSAVVVAANMKVPSAANVFADTDCLTAIGDTRDIVLYNSGATSSFVLDNAIAGTSASTSLMY